MQVRIKLQLCDVSILFFSHLIRLFLRDRAKKFFSSPIFFINRPRRQQCFLSACLFYSFIRSFISIHPSIHPSKKVSLKMIFCQLQFQPKFHFPKLNCVYVYGCGCVCSFAAKNLSFFVAFPTESRAKSKAKQRL